MRYFKEMTSRFAEPDDFQILIIDDKEGRFCWNDEYKWTPLTETIKDMLKRDVKRNWLKELTEEEAFLEML